MLICVSDARAGRVNNTAFQQAVTFQCCNLDVPIQWEVSQRTKMQESLQIWRHTV